MTSKGLKALDKLRFAVSIAQDLPYKECNELCDTIKQALERLEEYEKLSNCYEVAECYNGVRFIKCPLEQELDKVKQENQELKKQRLDLSLQLQDYRLVKEITLPNVLEENEKLEEENQELKEDMKYYEELGKDFYEYSTALEIIIKKNINLNILKTVFNGVLKFYPDMVKEYNSRIHNGMFELDSDEIRILHTVLHKIDIKCFLNEIKRGR